MQTSAHIAGFIMRATDRTKTAEFYLQLGLSAQAHEHGGPIHFELGPTDKDCVAEIYLASDKFPKDALMVKVLSLDAALTSLNTTPEIREVADMRLSYVTDPDGREVMLYEDVRVEACAAKGLAGEHCLPCDGISALNTKAIKKYLNELDGWELFDGRLEKTFTRKDFPDAALFVAALVPITEKEQHHPDVAIYDYKYVGVSLITKAIKALSINDFILAAKIDELVN